MRAWTLQEDENADWYVETPDGHRFYFGNIEGTGSCCFKNANYIVEACNNYKKIVDIIDNEDVNDDR